MSTPNIIGFFGMAGAGKNTAAGATQYLIYKNNLERGGLGDNISIGEFLELNGEIPNTDIFHSGWTLKSFAHKLKQMGSLVSGEPVEKYSIQEFKSAFMSQEWDTPVGRATNRDLLEGMGNKLREYNQNFWLNCLFADYIPSNKHSINPDFETYPNWILTDGRYINEEASIKSRGGITILITDPKISRPLLQSESELHLLSPNYEIINDGTIEDLAESIGVILEKEGIWVKPSISASIR